MVARSKTEQYLVIHLNADVNYFLQVAELHLTDASIQRSFCLLGLTLLFDFRCRALLWAGRTQPVAALGCAWLWMTGRRPPGSPQRIHGGSHAKMRLAHMGCASPQHTSLSLLLHPGMACKVSRCFICLQIGRTQSRQRDAQVIVPVIM